VISCFLPSFILFILTPLAVYVPNRHEFSFHLLDVLFPFIALGIIGGTVTFVIFLLSGRFRASIILVSIFLSSLLLITGQIFAPSVEVVLDGGNRNVGVDGLSAITEIGIIVLIGGLFVVFRKQMYANLRFVVFVVGLWAIGSMVPTLSNLVGDHRGSIASASSELIQLSRISRNFNIFHIMFDSLQGDMFAEILDEHPELKESFAGFVHFSNHSGYSNWTTLSISAILANKLYFEEVSDTEQRKPIDNIKHWLREESLFRQLGDAGFRVQTLQPGNFLCDDMPYTCMTVAMVEDQLRPYLQTLDVDEKGHDACWPGGMICLSLIHARIGDFTLFRVTPIVLKEYIYRQGNWILGSWWKEWHPNIALNNLKNIEKDLILSVAFAKSYTRSLTASHEKPSYQFLHFFPPHKPFILDEDCKLIGDVKNQVVAENQWMRYKKQAICSVRLFARFLDRLRELGVFDNSVIILQSDTGLGMYPPSFGREGTDLLVIDEIAGYTPPQLTAYANAVLAVKPLNQNTPFKRSKAPTHHADTVPTILQLAGLSGEDQSRSTFFDFETIDHRKRSFVVSHIPRAHSPRIAPFHRFEIDGDVRNFSAWTDRGLYSDAKTLLGDLKPITSVRLLVDPPGPQPLGTRVTFKAKVLGGTPPISYLFFRRTSENQDELIQDWSEKNTAEWEIGGPMRDPCRAEILVAARNEFEPDESKHISKEINIGILKENCN